MSTITVVATERGYYGSQMRMPGDEFQFTPVDKPKGFEGKWKGDKLPSWMEEVKKKAKSKKDQSED